MLLMRKMHVSGHSMEGIGIDVVTLAADCGLHYHNGVHTVTYFSILFW